jgi:hypothetical protein
VYREDYMCRKIKVVQRVQGLESDGFLLSRRLDRFCVHFDFERILPKNDFYKNRLQSCGV